MSRKLKILIWDIEITPDIVTVYPLARKYRNFINYHAIQQHSYIACACWKELGKKKVHSTSVSDNKSLFSKDHTDDYHVVKTMADAIREADVLIAHNGDKFDLKTLNARLAYHNLPPLPKVLTIDTLKAARQIGIFPSNGLNGLAAYFKLDGKIDTDYTLWEGVMKGSKKSLKEMVRYCKQDVRLNEEVYLRLRPYMRTHPNLADVESRNCPKCNSINVHKHKVRLMASGRRKQQYHCQDCGSYHTAKEILPEQPLTRN